MDIFNLYKSYLTTKQKSDEFKGLCFTALADTNISYYTLNNDPTFMPNIKYSTDGINWINWEYGISIPISPNGPINKIYIKGNNPNGFNISNSKYTRFLNSNNSQSLKISGNINSLISDDDGTKVTTIPAYCYTRLFYKMNGLVDVSELSLSAIILGESCYYYMFHSCSTLLTCPELPATTLAMNCYSYMFTSCTSLKNGPSSLPATTLVEKCYYIMFGGCTQLITTPKLLATTLAKDCYSMMFYTCSKVNTIKLAYTGNFDSNYFNSWVDGVAFTGNFYYNGTDITRGPSAIPNGWTVHTF